MAVGLRHNHDISMILTRTKGLAMIFYITNYATNFVNLRFIPGQILPNRIPGARL